MMSGFCSFIFLCLEFKHVVENMRRETALAFSKFAGC